MQPRNNPTMRSTRLGISAAAIVSIFAINVHAQHVPTVGPQFDLASPTLSIPERIDEFWAATSGAEVLTVWNESDQGASSGCYGTLVHPDGTLGALVGFPILTGPVYSADFVVYAGSKFVVAGHDYESGLWTWRAVLVDPSTAAVTPVPAPLYQASDAPLDMVAAGSSNAFMIAWQPVTGGQEDIHARLFSSDLQPIGGELAIETTPHRSSRLQVASDGAGWLVTWIDSTTKKQILGRRISPTGAILNADPLVIADVESGFETTALGAADGRYLQFYSGGPQTSTTTIVPIEADGTVKPAIESVVDYGSTLQVRGDGQKLVLSYLGNCLPDAGPYGAGLCASLVDSQGTLISTIPSQVSYGYYLDPIATIAGGNVLLTGLDANSTPLVAESVTGPDFLTHSTPITVSIAEDSAIMPAVAYDGSHFVVVWSDLHEGTSRDLVAVRVAPDGTVLDPSPVLLVARPGDQLYPKVVFDGSQFRLIWVDTDGIRASLLSPGLNMQQPEGSLVLPSSNETPIPLNGVDLATDGTTAVIAVVGTESVELLRFDSSWLPQQPGTVSVFTSPDGGSGLGLPSVSYGGHFLVSWIGGAHELHAARVDSLGQVLDHQVMDPMNDHVLGWRNFKSTFGSDRFLLSWDTAHVFNYPRGARIGIDGSPYGGNSFDIVPYESETDVRSTSAVFDGSEFVLAMELGKHSEKVGLRLVSLGLDGPPSAPEDIALQPSQLQPIQSRNAMASDCAGHTLLAYETLLGSGSHRVSQVRARMLVRDSAAAPGAGCVIPTPINGKPDGGAAGSGGDGADGSAGGAAGNTAYEGGVGGFATGDAGPGNLAESAQSAEGGCGCQVPGQRSTNAVHWIALTLGLSALASRKRRRPDVCIGS